MRLREVALFGYRSVNSVEFALGPFSVLFGRNNSGKTNILEAIYGVLKPEHLNAYVKGHSPQRGLRGSEHGIPPLGAIKVDLERGLPFDDDLLQLRPEQDPDGLDRAPLPSNQATFIGAMRSRLTFLDIGADFHQLINEFDAEGLSWVERVCVDDGPRPQVLFLDWEIDDLDSRVGNTLMDLLSASSAHKATTEIGTVLEWLSGSSGPMEVFEPVDDSGSNIGWRVRDEVTDYLEDFARAVNMFLPDFLDGGSIHAELLVPITWGSTPSVRITYQMHDFDPEDERSDLISDLGRGSSRWVAVAIQMALDVLAPGDYDSRMTDDPRSLFSGRVLFLDEPEAHLHPHAVASIVRWCRKMVELGFNVLVATHHEAFLRTSGDDVTFVHITRHARSGTHARTLISSATPLLQDLATELGMHPATALSLNRAILFVEGPLDKAVIDEYAGPQLDAAGVTIIPIHGTRNLQGLIDGELTTHLGIKTGVLTDNTVTATIWDRSNRKRSSEEIKLVRLIKQFEDKGLPPPDLFGVPEDDLLFALPSDAIREYLDAPFPGWRELREECRIAEGKGPSDSVDWKSYAENRYGLPITTSDGVRAVIHALDLAGVELPSIRAVVDEIVNWAKASDDIV